MRKGKKDEEQPPMQVRRGDSLIVRLRASVVLISMTMEAEILDSGKYTKFQVELELPKGIV